MLGFALVLHGIIFFDLVESNSKIKWLIHVIPNNQLARNPENHLGRWRNILFLPPITHQYFHHSIGSNIQILVKIDLNLIAQKLDKVDLFIDKCLALGQQSPVQYTQPSNYQKIYSICASSAHHVSECLTAAQFSPFIQEQVQAAQGYSNPVNDLFSNIYNQDWRNYFNFSWRP